MYKVDNPSKGLNGGIRTPNGNLITSAFDLVTELNNLYRQVQQPAIKRYSLKVHDGYPQLVNIQRPDGTFVHNEPIFGHPGQEIEQELNRQQAIIRANQS